MPAFSRARARGITDLIRAGNLSRKGHAPRAGRGGRVVAAVDVEWTKNYRIRGGNVPFCYSIVYLCAPSRRSTGFDRSARFFYESAYVESDDETGDLVASIDERLQRIQREVDCVIGHQLSSDLAVLAQASSDHLPGVEALRSAWHARKVSATSDRAVVDTRYDIGEALTGTSRRLVDVCDELQLDVTQPELLGISMTALHRRWITSQVATARERITILNLRHSLSTGLVALTTAYGARWSGQLNVNRLLMAELEGQYEWLSTPVFQALVV
jgi:hypothetical protein